MLYPIFILLFIIFFILFLLRDSIVCGWFAVIFFILIFFWSIVGGYKTITYPIYNENLLESASIPELDTKKNKSGKYDIVYADRENKTVYIDNKTFEKNIVEIIETIETKDELKIEVYKYVPKNTYNTSVNLFFNQKTFYKIYVPKDYTIYTQLKMK